MDILAAVLLTVCRPLPPQHNGVVYQQCKVVDVELIRLPCIEGRLYNIANNWHDKYSYCLNLDYFPQLKDPLQENIG